MSNTDLLNSLGKAATTAFKKGGAARWAMIAVTALVVIGGVVLLATGTLTGSSGDTAGPAAPGSSTSAPGPAGPTPASDCYANLANKSTDENGGAAAEPSTVAEAKVAIDCLPVKEMATAEGYSRAQFGAAWTDKATGVTMAGNGCDTRDDILARDLTNVERKGKCQVTSGTLDDPYTGKTINFVRGPKTSLAVQVDHIVALKNAWQTGAQNLTEQQRTALANDPINLIAADGPANGAKGAKSADQWLPANTAVHCGYVASQVRVKNRYGLWVTPAEQATMKKVLAAC